jgi:hypothetical protein
VSASSIAVTNALARVTSYYDWDRQNDCSISPEELMAAQQLVDDPSRHLIWPGLTVLLV